MLPYTPLHHLLLRETGFPVVATSGNLSDEPICTDEIEAMQRLGHIADVFLVHDRPIARHVDDSVAWIVRGVPRLLRRARGYAPLPVMLKDAAPTILAVGAHLKNTIALSVGRQVFISQHIGDLETPEAMAAFERVIADFLRLYEAQPVAIAHDLHPEYLSTKWATEISDDFGYRITNDDSPQIRNPQSTIPSSPSSTTTRISQLAWPKTRSMARRWASRGTAPATASMGRSGAASFCWGTHPASSAWRICDRSACRAAMRR